MSSIIKPLDDLLEQQSVLGQIKLLEQKEAQKETQEETFNYYLLLEGDLNENLYDEVSKIEFTSRKHWVYEDTEFDDEKEHGPLLVALDDENKQIEHFVENSVKQHMGVLISTQASVDELIQHLLNLRYVNIPNRDQKHKILFRWYEPRQLLGLLSSFDDKETAYFMNNINSISWCEWAHDQGTWYQRIKPKITDTPAFAPFLSVQQKTVDALAKQDEHFFIRQITRELIDEYPELLIKGDEKALQKSVKNQTNKAISNGIDRRDDIKEFICSNLMLH